MPPASRGGARRGSLGGGNGDGRKAKQTGVLQVPSTVRQAVRLSDVDLLGVHAEDQPFRRTVSDGVVGSRPASTYKGKGTLVRRPNKKSAGAVTLRLTRTNLMMCHHMCRDQFDLIPNDEWVQEWRHHRVEAPPPLFSPTEGDGGV